MGVQSSDRIDVTFIYNSLYKPYSLMKLTEQDIARKQKNLI